MGAFDTFGMLKDRVREGLADSTDSFFTPTEIGLAINEGMWELYKIVHAANVGFFFNTTPETITLSPTTNFYNLTNDFAWIDEITPHDSDTNDMIFYFRDRHDQVFRDLLTLSVNQLFVASGVYYYDVVGNRSMVVVPRPSQSVQIDVYTVQDPTEMELDAAVPPFKPLFRPLIVEYAVRKLKNKEETGEYMSHEKLLGFLFDNASKYIKPRGGTNALVVDEY